MFSFKQYIAELFDKKGDISYDGVVHPDRDKTVALHDYSFHDSVGRKYTARISHYQGDNSADVQFADQDDEMGVTGKARHSAHHVFGRMKQILDYHNEHVLKKPENEHVTQYVFSSEKEQKPGRWNKYQEGSRNKLYRKFTAKMGGSTREGTEDNEYSFHFIPVKRGK